MEPHIDPTRNGVIIDKRYELQHTLGKGKFAVVKLARHMLTEEQVAIKVIDKNKLDSISKQHLYKEVTCMKLLRHPNVIRLYEAIDTTNYLFLIMELGDAGDLYDYIMKFEKGIEEAKAKIFFGQMVNALAYCHCRHVVHRDLKPENMVICSESESIKLTDFGFSNIFEDGKTLQTSCGSLAYSAPEILLGEEYDASAVDVWSLGVILYMLVCGEAPFNETNDSETLTMIMDCKYQELHNVSEECRDLINKILRREPEDRIKIRDIMQHAWLRDITIDETVVPGNIEHYGGKELIKSKDHDKICSFLRQLAPIEEITNALENELYNSITAAYLLFAEKNERAKFGRESTRVTPRSTHISPIPSQPASPRSTSPTPGTSPPRGPRHLSGKMSPAPLLPREHLTITPRKGPVTKEGIEHLAEEERTSRSQTTTDDEDEPDKFSKLLSPDETLSLVGAKLRAAGREGGNSRSKNRSEKRDRSNTGNRSNSELKEICEEPESELDDFDVEASPRQNRLKMGASPSCTRRRRNRPDQRDESSGSPTQLQPTCDNLYSSTLSTASSDSESSESRRTSSRDLSIYAAQVRKYRDRRDRDSSDERDPQNQDTKETDKGSAKTKQSDNSSKSNTTNNEKNNTTATTTTTTEKRQTPTAEKSKRRLRKKRFETNGDAKPPNRTDFALDSIAEKSLAKAIQAW